MTKEYFIMCYDKAIEDLMEENNIESDQAEEILISLLEKNTSYLDGYISYE